mmetsp:Transcript_26437/g.84090  ORF Transcript_26437/g.84090 Transcript_26437/m.84090 type:complete len:92 (-) Transcript_26437:77-352(-)
MTIEFRLRVKPTFERSKGRRSVEIDPSCSYCKQAIRDLHIGGNEPLVAHTRLLIKRQGLCCSMSIPSDPVIDFLDRFLQARGSEWTRERAR